MPAAKKPAPAAKAPTRAAAKAPAKPPAKAPAKTPVKAPAKGWTTAKDDRADRKAGIKENGPRDKALDRKRGVK